MELSNAVKIFKALSNESRLRLFKMIYDWSKDCLQSKPESGSCCGIEKSFTKACGCMKISRSTISHHFKELQNAGLITCSRTGRYFICHVNKEAVETIKEIF